MQTLQYPESHILSDYRRLQAHSQRITMGKMAPEALKKGLHSKYYTFQITLITKLFD